MTLFHAVVLGMVQGITEFFPVSSSGHLVIFQSLFGMKEPQVAFDVFLHLGTLVSILIFLRKDILNLFGKGFRLGLYVILASVPTFLIGFFFKDFMERFFAMPRIAGCMLLVTAVWLALANFYGNNARERKNLGSANSIAIGIVQGIAIMPGISRSGATIGAGLLAGLDRELAFKFSFLLAIPAILGASVVKCARIGEAIAGSDAAVFSAGAAAAMLTGLFTMKVLLKMVRNGHLYPFAVYCAVAGTFIILAMR